MFTPDAIDAMVADRGERLRLEADRTHLVRSARRRNRQRARLLPRLLGGLRAAPRRADPLLRVVPPHTS